MVCTDSNGIFMTMPSPSTIGYVNDSYHVVTNIDSTYCSFTEALYALNNTKNLRHGLIGEFV